MTFYEVTTMSAPGFSSLDLGGSSSEIPVASYSVRSSTLGKISDLLIRGERKQAYQYALDEKLWAHAMVIASSLDKDAWKEAVTEFVRTELGSAPSSQSSASVGSPTGREPLRVAYSFFAGQGAASRKYCPLIALQQRYSNIVFSTADDASKPSIECCIADIAGPTLGSHVAAGGSEGLIREFVQMGGNCGYAAFEPNDTRLYVCPRSTR
jgi:hypothetical protein